MKAHSLQVESIPFVAGRIHQGRVRPSVAISVEGRVRVGVEDMVSLQSMLRALQLFFGRWSPCRWALGQCSSREAVASVEGIHEELGAVPEGLGGALQ